MLSYGTMDEWWTLTGRYEEYRRPTHMLLKEYGYMKLFELMDERKPGRVLEFGHGFHHILMSRYQDQCEMHGIDDFQAIDYFPPKDEWERYYETYIRDNCPRCTLHRGLLGDPSVDLDDNSFDVIASVSVLEELPGPELHAVLSHASRLLKPGGVLAGSYDFCTERVDVLEGFIGTLRKCGFDAPAKGWTPDPPQERHNVLIESPSTVMMTYYMSQGENRQYRGHWSTLWFCFEKKPVAQPDATPLETRSAEPV